MRILLIGEASFVHNTLKKGLMERGHEVILMSDGNNWHNSPRDIDLRRNKKWLKFGGFKVLWKLFVNWRTLIGNDVVQIHNYQFIPLKMFWNKLMISFLKKHNKCVVKGCYGDDYLVLKRQSEGVPFYSDTFWNGKEQNIEENKWRIEEQNIPSFVSCWRKTSQKADALVACLYEYFLCYNINPFAQKLHYIPLPIIIPEKNKIKGKGEKIKVLIGIQPDRDYVKGARKIASFIEEINRRNPEKLKIDYVENIPYKEYCNMLEEADVLVDQLYSFTPSMNSLKAMAYGTVVIGGGEEDFYNFIGEKVLRPIINVSPEFSDEENVEIIEKILFTEGNLEKLSKESIEFTRKYHDYRKVAEQYENLYRQF